MVNCKNSEWSDSTVTRQGVVIEQATFTIGSVSGQGDFDGEFQEAGGSVEAIEGKCAGASITFVRPKGNPVFRYEGIFVSVGTRVFSRGQRTQIFFPLSDLQERLKNIDTATLTESERGAREVTEIMQLTSISAFGSGDDWVAEKTT